MVPRENKRILIQNFGRQAKNIMVSLKVVYKCYTWNVCGSAVRNLTPTVLKPNVFAFIYNS